MIKKIFLICFLAIFLIGIISASDVCCEKTTNNAWCQNAKETQCDNNFRKSPNSCENTGFCKRGCCIDNTGGLCDKGAVQEECEEGQGIWKSSEMCEVPECKQGCCILEDESEFVTQKRCEFLSLMKGVEGYVDWEISKAGCRSFSNALGACIVGEFCSLETEEPCQLKGGAYYLGKLCSNPDLETNCEKQSYVGCVDGKDEIYWFDSCGNRENIYSSNKYASWNNGEVLTKAASCNPDSGNIDSGICGNCNRFLGSVCSSSNNKKINDGNYVCKNLGCDEDGNGINERQNGESWCVYDTYVGDSKDFPGSTHWKRTCVDGNIEVEDCGNKRNLICAEKTIDSFSIAQCRINLGISCYSLTKEKCTTIPDCRVQDVYIDQYFKFSACVPKYPFGFDLSSTDKLENGKDICSIATQTCTVVYVKESGGVFSSGKWKCKGNCNCLTTSFAEQMNDFCISLGDCGGDINIEEDYIGSFAISGSAYSGLKNLKNSVIAKYKPYLTKKNSDNTPKYLVSEETISYLGGGIIGGPEIPDIEDEDFWDNVKDYPNRVTESPENFNLYNVEAMFMGGGLYDLTKFLLGVGKTEKKQITFTCLPWRSPVGGENCEKCHADPLKPCSEYICKNLGQSCGLINEDYENPLCINKYSDDTVPPKITSKEVSNKEYNFENEKDNGVEISGSEKCIPEFTLLNFSLETNEYAQCYADFKRASPGNYTNMEFLPEELNAFSLIHNFDIRIPSIDSPCIDSENSAIYVVCNDPAGNFNINNYVIDFCIKQGPDLTAANIIRANPVDKGFLPYRTTNSFLEIYLNEPAECGYSLSQNSKYEDMPKMICEQDRLECSQEYSCITNLENLGLENKFYIKCNDTAGNINTEDYEYTLYVTENQLKIDSISPIKGTIIESSGPIDLNVKTSGGVNNGVSSCSYIFEEKAWSDLFTETNSANHKYTFTSLGEGDYSILVECEDTAKNIAINSTQFKIDLDLEPPEVVRVYNEAGNLKIITNEKARCYYDFNNCNFNTNEKDYEFSMTTIFSTEHTAEWIFGKTYYIKCKDIYDNINPTCAVIAKPIAI